VRVKESIASAVNWFEQSKIVGKRVITVTGGQYENGRDRMVVDDASAPPMWARFYDLETNRPFFCSRDGVKQASMAEISWERRMHYAWYGSWPRKVLDAYPKWKKRVGG
jgi:PelA/Pel-15E family pectate lyase